METVKNFFESSTIHGLSYISSTKKFIRLFWVLIVIAGFTGAGVLIYHSFQAWGESPVTTSIETLPIAKIAFPKVTVCPPTNTLTNLNYDLVMTENMTLDEDSRKDLAFLAMKLANGQKFEEIMRNLSMFEEENRYYNWYNAFTVMRLPFYKSDKFNNTDNFKALSFSYETGVASGSISTQKFGLPFDANILTGNVSVDYAICVPNKPDFSTHNATLHFEIEILKDINGLDSFVFLDQKNKDETILNRHIKHHSKNFIKIKTNCFEFSYDKMITNGFLSVHNEMMPGFKMKWFFTGETMSNSGNKAWGQNDSPCAQDFRCIIDTKSTLTAYRR